MATRGIAVRVVDRRQGVTEREEGVLTLVLGELGVHDPFDRRREVPVLDDDTVGELLGRRQFLDRGDSVVPNGMRVASWGPWVSFLVVTNGCVTRSCTKASLSTTTPVGSKG